jgi:hypothetical protein
MSSGVWVAIRIGVRDAFFRLGSSHSVRPKISFALIDISQ